ACRYAKFAAELLGIALGSFEAGRVSRGPATHDPSIYEIVGQTRHQRSLGPYYDEIDSLCLAKGDHLRMVGDAERHGPSNGCTTRIARGDEEIAHRRGPGACPRQCMFPGARA